MVFVRFFRWLLGWVKLDAEGGFPERLLNQAARQNISLWSSSRRGITLTTCCYARSYRKLRPLAKKASVRMRVRERHGLPFTLRKYQARLGLAAGAVVFILLLQLLSSRIWIIDIQGNSLVSDETILEALEPLGIREGGTFKGLDISDLQLTALKQLPDLTWLAVNLDGSTVHVEVQERGVHAPLQDDIPSNIKAARDGKIIRVEVTGGQAMVKPGEAVTKGTLLISGVVESKTGPLLQRSSGRIIAETTRVLTVEVPLNETRLLPTGDTIFRPAFSLFGIRIPLYTDGTVPKDCSLNTQRHMLTAYGKELPVGFLCEEYRLLEAVSISRTEEEAAALAHQALDERELAQLGQAEILTSVREGRMENGTYILTGTYVCQEDIGVEEQLYTDPEKGKS